MLFIYMINNNILILGETQRQFYKLAKK